MAAKPKDQVQADEAVECVFCKKSRSVPAVPSVLAPNTADRKPHARKSKAGSVVILDINAYNLRDLAAVSVRIMSHRKFHSKW